MTTTHAYEEKSHVGMGHDLCPACGAEHNEVVLLDKRLMKTLTSHMRMGTSLCPECKAKSTEYLALIECTGDPNNDTSAQMTGNVAHVRWHAAEQIFDLTPDTMIKLQTLGFTFVEVGVIDKLRTMMQHGETQ